MAKIGFIGTGIMGQPMAANLQKAGHQLFLSEHHGKAAQALVASTQESLKTGLVVATHGRHCVVELDDGTRIEAQPADLSALPACAGQGAGPVRERTPPEPAIQMAAGPAPHHGQSIETARSSGCSHKGTSP